MINKRHLSDYFGMSFNEKRDAEALLALLRKQIVTEDPSVTGFNVGMNCGEVAGQTVMHAHIHLIPRRAGDVEAPRVGCGGVCPGRGGINSVKVMKWDDSRFNNRSQLLEQSWDFLSIWPVALERNKA